jgi:Uri superfamily endonuclease
MERHKTLRFLRSPTFVPPIERWPAVGVYQLRLRVSVTIRVRVGRLGRFTFPPGMYVYTGRAARGLRARVLRHVTGARTRHWHIDYLLARGDVHVERVELVSDDPVDECAANRRVGAAGRVPAPGFGSSDCKAGCGTHLWHIVSGHAESLPPARHSSRGPCGRSDDRGRLGSGSAGGEIVGRAGSYYDRAETMSAKQRCC